MPKKEEHKIKKLIQSIELETPSENFTESVMMKIHHNTNEEVLKDKILTSLLKKNGQETPSVNFVDNVMAQLQRVETIEYKPIISKKMWGILFSLFVGFILYSFFYEPTISDQTYIAKYVSMFDNIISDFGNSLVKNIQIPSILFVSTFCLSTLLLIDYFLNSKRYRTE